MRLNGEFGKIEIYLYIYGNCILIPVMTVFILSLSSNAIRFLLLTLDIPDLTNLSLSSPKID